VSDDGGRRRKMGRLAGEVSEEEEEKEGEEEVGRGGSVEEDLGPYMQERGTQYTLKRRGASGEMKIPNLIEFLEKVR